MDKFETVAITFILILTEFEFEENVIALHYVHSIFSKRQKVSPHRRKPENPKRTAKIKLRSSETQPTCSICKRGGDNYLPLIGSTRSAARQTVKRSGISALTYSYDNCGFWYRMVSPSQSFSGSHATFPQSRYWEKLDKLSSSL